jgi:hypothetical protein
MMVPPMPFIMPMMLILHKGRLVNQVPRKCHRRYPQPWEGSLESVVSCEGTGVSPLLTAQDDMSDEVGI